MHAPVRGANQTLSFYLAPALLLAILMFLALPAAIANETHLPRNSFGSVGLIDMPSARMAPDGELSASADFFRNTQRYALGFQILPWLEGSFRYSGLDHFDTAYPVYYDRSFALKARLWNETDLIPTLSVGVNDLVGTGVYGGEFVVLSKRLGDVDASIGMGWGRLSTAGGIKNPLTLLAGSLEKRPGLATPGGTNFDAIFHGRNAAFFGGAVWHTPIDGLALIAEFSSDKYTLETSRGNFRPRSQFNWGLSYQASDSVTVGLAWLYGTSIGGSVSLQLDPTVPPFPEKIVPPATDVRIRSPEEQRLALQTLLQRREHREQEAFPPVAQIRLAAKNDFVDALWRESQPGDVYIRGRLLVLTAARNAMGCEAAARLVRDFGGGIDSITVRGVGAPSHCTVPLSGSATINAGYDTTALVRSPEPAGAGVMTIDAAVPEPAATRAIHQEATEQYIGIEAVSLTDDEAVVYYSNNHYFSEADAIERLVRILMARTPGTVEKFRLIAVQDGIPQQEFGILRAPQERDFTQNGTLAVLGTTTHIQPAPAENPVLTVAQSTSYPRFSWELYPQFRQQLFDPSQPFGSQILLAARGKVELLPGFSLSGTVETSLFDNFQTGRLPSSTLPHVRSDFLEYFAQGKTGLGAMEAEYRLRLAPDVFAIARAGYLESMFAGVGGEVLWRPQRQRWALGIDLYQVWQRDFDRRFGLRDYHVLTGHVSLYYASPWHDLNFALRAGRYLARDKGITLEVSRRFSTGVEIGAYATKTNVSAAQFGEGSFDKGIFIRIPLGAMAPIETQGEVNLNLRPVQRDGGQRLIGDALLYEETRRSSLGELELHRRVD